MKMRTLLRSPAHFHICASCRILMTSTARCLLACARFRTEHLLAARLRIGNGARAFRLSSEASTPGLQVIIVRHGQSTNNLIQDKVLFVCVRARVHERVRLLVRRSSDCTCTCASAHRNRVGLSRCMQITLLRLPAQGGGEDARWGPQCRRGSKCVALRASTRPRAIRKGQAGRWSCVGWERG
jgi:hypothetical protein